MGEIFLNSGKNIKVDNSEEYLLEYLLKRKKELGSWPTYEQMWPSNSSVQNPDTPSQFSYAYNFKTYDDALEEAKTYERRKGGMKPTAALRSKYKDYFAHK